MGFTYDNAGNLTGDSAFTYSYDGANRMKQAQQIASPNTLTSSTFFGPLRIKKTVGSNTTIYVYSGAKPIAEYVSGSLNKEYIYAGSTLLATVAGTSTIYHHPDHLSNRAETDANGTPVRNFGHFPYSEVWYETGTPDPLKFTSYTRDSGTGESGLDYAIARFSSFTLGRFISPDPLPGQASQPQSLNRYAYVRNDPVNLVDPFGLFAGNFRCRLLDHGDCAGGNYFGYSWTAGTPVGVSGTCTVDGQAVGCDTALSVLAMGAGRICPDNDCSLRYDPRKGFVPPLRTGPNGNWQIWEPGYEYYDPDQATPGNSNGFGYRNGRYVPDPDNIANALGGMPYGGLPPSGRPFVVMPSALQYKAYLGTRAALEIPSRITGDSTDIICTKSPTHAVLEGAIGGTIKGAAVGVFEQPAGAAGAVEGAINGAARPSELELNFLACARW